MMEQKLSAVFEVLLLADIWHVLEDVSMVFSSIFV